MAWRTRPRISKYGLRTRRKPKRCLQTNKQTEQRTKEKNSRPRRRKREDPEMLRRIPRNNKIRPLEPK